MAYWGQAMSLFRQLWSIPEPADLKNGSELMQHAQAVHAKTQRERDYIDALAVFYRDYDKTDHYVRAEAYSHAMETVYKRYPDDHEAAAFYALSLLTWGKDPEEALNNAKQAIGILNGIFEKDPNEPGVAHYLIHAADDPRLA